MTTIGPGRRISAGSTPHEIGEGPTKSLRPRSGPALFDIEPLGGRVKLGVVHDDLEPGNTTAKAERRLVGLWHLQPEDLSRKCELVALAPMNRER